MGADGGTIPLRIELVKTKGRAKREDPSIAAASKWRFCQLTARPLQQPVVACELGQLYNKESVLQALLTAREEGTPMPQAMQHIKSMKDVHELHFSASAAQHAGVGNGDGSAASASTSAAASSSSMLADGGETAQAGVEAEVGLPFVCPVVGTPINGRHRFVYARDCGCVVSERALREIPSETCHVVRR